MRDRFLAHDVTAKVKLPRQRKAEAEMSIPSPAEVGELLRAADPQFEAFIALCAFAGLRLGEAAALQVSDIDFLARKFAYPARYSARTVAKWRFGRPSSEVSALCTHPTGLSPCCQNTSVYTGRAISQTAGCSPAKRASHYTKTPVVIGGAEPEQISKTNTGCTI